MNSDQVTGILRALVPAFIAYAVGRGWVSASSAGEVGAAIITLGAAGWSVYTNTLASKVASVKADPTITAVTPTPLATPAVKAAAAS